MSTHKYFSSFEKLGQKLGLGEGTASEPFTNPSTKFTDAYTDAKKHVDAFHEAYAAAGEADKALLTGLESHVAETQSALGAIAKKEGGKWIPNGETVTKEQVEKAERLAKEATGKLQATLKGIDKLRDETLPQLENKTLVDLYKKAEAQTTNLTKTADGVFLARAKVNGLGAAAKKGFSEMNVLGEKKGLAFGRIAGVAAGGALVMDAFRSKTKDGQDRSFVARLGEGALGASGMGLAIAGGRAF